jgi:hypothetical protein
MKASDNAPASPMATALLQILMAIPPKVRPERAGEIHLSGGFCLFCGGRPRPREKLFEAGTVPADATKGRNLLRGKENPGSAMSREPSIQGSMLT